MKIGIIVAMEKELSLLLNLLHDHARTVVNNTTFHTGTIDGRQVVIAQSGIGKVNAAISTLSLIDTFHPALIINTGVAGGTGNGAHVLDVILASGIIYHDVWCGPGTQWGEAAGCPTMFQCPIDATQIAPQLGAKHGIIASGDTFISTVQQLDEIRRHVPDAIACEMESGAIAQVCHIKNVPMICLRVISDTPGQVDDNISQYNDFWTQAPQETFDTLRKLLAIITTSNN